MRPSSNTPTRAWRQGAVLGRYVLKYPIGRGGMAEVWRASLKGVRDFNRAVVLKRLLPEVAADPEIVAMFTTEALLSARLSHHNIVQVIEFGEADGEPFIAMEYVEGLNLGLVLKQLRPLGEIPIGLAVYVAREVCSALAYAHALKDEEGHPLRLVHRDISPSNIMVTVDGSVKILDFGIAKALNAATEETRSGVLKGKLGYLPPEVLEGSVADATADLFATGVVLHEMLAGRRLWKGRDDLHTMSLVRQGAVPVPSTVRAGVPPALDEICRRALAAPRERYASADDMASDLSSLLHALDWDNRVLAAYLREHEIAVTPEALSPHIITGEQNTEPQPRSAGETDDAPRASARTWQLATLVLGAALTVGLIIAVPILRARHAAPPVVPAPSVAPAVAAAPAEAAPVEPAIVLPTPPSPTPSLTPLASSPVAKRVRVVERTQAKRSSQRTAKPAGAKPHLKKDDVLNEW